MILVLVLNKAISSRDTDEASITWGNWSIWCCFLIWKLNQLKIPSPGVADLDGKDDTEYAEFVDLHLKAAGVSGDDIKEK